MKIKILFKTYLMVMLFCFGTNYLEAQTCGACAAADFAAGCNQGGEDTGGDGSFYTGVTPPNFLYSPNPIIVGGGAGQSVPEYCFDFTTPADVNGNPYFAACGLSLLSTTDDGGNTCGFGLATIDIYDAACTVIAMDAAVPDPGGNWDCFTDPANPDNNATTGNYILASTTYTMCIDYGTSID